MYKLYPNFNPKRPLQERDKNTKTSVFVQNGDAHCVKRKGQNKSENNTIGTEKYSSLEALQRKLKAG